MLFVITNHPNELVQPTIFVFRCSSPIGSIKYVMVVALTKEQAVELAKEYLPIKLSTTIRSNKSDLKVKFDGFDVRCGDLMQTDIGIKCTSTTMGNWKKVGNW